MRPLIIFAASVAILAAGSASAQFLGEGIWKSKSGAAPSSSAAVATALVIPNLTSVSPSTVVAPIGGM